MDTEVVLEVIFFFILFETLETAFRERKQNIIRNREAAFDRLKSYSENEFRRRFRMHRCNELTLTQGFLGVLMEFRNYTGGVTTLRALMGR
jgi:hypothetical protein